VRGDNGPQQFQRKGAVMQRRRAADGFFGGLQQDMWLLRRNVATAPAVEGHAPSWPLQLLL
jgi:hypothetical protein